ncbi:hypothetical protein DQ04_10131010 [Trypanosoma grayi]|uniref:hypothetical protein n=1 Tax=Trypanosoma grayi TaxID=71804 RepID=UPI0004F440B3|nr:hypothetical protein DQ04_10131010 [Trypanosoma grayi]KEG07336.1 hypothetical protein DQ04_10131010 [Trypanosoma grayi]
MMVTVRHVLFVLSLALCCACGCVAAAQQPQVLNEGEEGARKTIADSLSKAQRALEEVRNEFKKAEKAVQDATAAQEAIEGMGNQGSENWDAKEAVERAKGSQQQVAAAVSAVDAHVKAIEVLRDQGVGGAETSVTKERLEKAKTEAENAQSLVQQAKDDAGDAEKAASDAEKARNTATKTAAKKPSKPRHNRGSTRQRDHQRPKQPRSTANNPQQDAGEFGKHAADAGTRNSQDGFVADDGKQGVKERLPDSKQSHEAPSQSEAKHAVEEKRSKEGSVAENTDATKMDAEGGETSNAAEAESSESGGTASVPASEGPANGQSAQGPAGGEGTPETAAGFTHNAQSIGAGISSDVGADGSDTHTLVCAPLLLVVLATLACGAVSHVGVCPTAAGGAGYAGLRCCVMSSGATG